MFTDDSIFLKEYLFPKMSVTDSREYKSLYQFLKNRQPLEIKIKSHKIQKIMGLKIDSPFVSQKVIDQLDTLNQSFELNLFIGNINLTINIYYSFHNIERFLNEIIPLIRLLFSISPIKTKRIILNYYLIDVKKELKQNLRIPCIIGKDEANSGSCLRDINKSIVNIWRTEEIAKVTIHELIHALEYDYFEDTNGIIDHYKDKYNIISDKINTNEAYTELWANLINFFWISQKVRKKQYDLFITLIGLEKEFCKFQAFKIFYVTQLSTLEIDINQNTNTLAYYIIRCELYHRLPQFLKMCRENFKDYIKINPEKWFDFLLKNKLLKKNNRRFNKINDRLMNTTRMTCVEYQLF